MCPDLGFQSIVSMVYRWPEEGFYEWIIIISYNYAPVETPYLIEVSGSSQEAQWLEVRKVNDKNGIRGVEEKAASVFYLETVGDGKFKIKFDGEGQYKMKYIARYKPKGKESIQVSGGVEPLEFTLADGTIDDWKKGKVPCQIKIVSDKGYFGYSNQHGLVEYFPREPRDASLLFKLKEMKWDDKGKVQRTQPLESGGSADIDDDD